jgi:hypothetical protein
MKQLFFKCAYGGMEYTVVLGTTFYGFALFFGAPTSHEIPKQFPNNSQTIPKQFPPNYIK